MSSEIGVTKSASESADVELFVAVDTGGTKTAACLVDLAAPQDNCVLGRGRGSAGNPFSVGFAEATRAIGSAIEQACSAAQQDCEHVSRIMLSIAGAANPQISQQFVHWAHDTYQADQVAIVSDVLPILAAGTPNCCGIALIAGTGSIAFGRAADGRTKRCGGWGYLLGDEGSGYSVGRSALSHALRELECETLWHPNSLTEAVVSKLKVKTVTELTKTVYTNDDPRSFIASLAPLVVIAAEHGDKKAEAILDWAATELAELVARTADLMDGSDGPISLALGGGFLVRSERIQEQLLEWLRKFNVECNATLVTDPLEGCIRLADPQFAGTLVTWHNA
jgi:N-acetylglucosamine kinase-like BadF-type ATPase